MGGSRAVVPMIAILACITVLSQYKRTNTTTMWIPIKFLVVWCIENYTDRLWMILLTEVLTWKLVVLDILISCMSNNRSDAWQQDFNVHMHTDSSAVSRKSMLPLWPSTWSLRRDSTTMRAWLSWMQVSCLDTSMRNGKYWSDIVLE